MSETRARIYCRNCSAELTAPDESGFELEGDWFCSPLCAEACCGFWSRGYELEDGVVRNVERVEDSDDAMRCPDCGVEHGEWTDAGTAANHDGRTTLDLWECDRCGYTLEGVRL